jgi:dipeptidyl-peptidase-4
MFYSVFSYSQAIKTRVRNRLIGFYPHQKICFCILKAFVSSEFRNQTHNMKNCLHLVVIFFFLSGAATAQQKNLTIEEAVLKQRTTLAPSTLKQLKWIKGTDDFSYVDSKEKKDVLVRGTATKTGVREILSLEQLNQQLRKMSADTFAAFPAIKWESANDFSFETGTKRMAYDFNTNEVSIKSQRDFGTDAENIDIEEHTGLAAFTVKNNLFISDGKTKTQVTADADSNIVNGKSVHREEFGIFKGTFWSEDGKYLAFYRMDQTMVTDYPVIDWTTQPAHVVEIKYPMAGAKSHHVTVGIYEVASGKKIFLQTGEPAEQYLTNLAWSPDDQHLYIAVLNRDQNHLQFNSYNTISGAFEKTLFEETNDKYVQPLHPMEFVKQHSNLFVWQSRTDGWNHLYLYDTNGKLIRQLTRGEWEVTNLTGFDEKGENVFFTCTAQSPLNRDLYSVNIKTGKMTRLTTGDGTHTITLQESGNYFIDSYSSTAIPRVITIANNQGKVMQTLLTASNPLKDFHLGQLSIFTIKNENGDQLYCRMIKPVNFDSTKKYPTIVYLYGGPNVQLITNTWNGGGDLWLQYMAEKGFVIFTLDNRGSANRGLKFEQAIFRHLGTAELKDQLAGISFLKHQRYVDTTRMGLFGWSFGGFMTTSMMTRYPDIFKAAVAGGPVTDWSYYEVMYTERYMDTPQDNAGGYKESRVLNYLPNLKGKLLLIHGTQDPVVVWQHSILFLKEAVNAGKHVDYFVYPGHEHNVLGKDRVNLMEKIGNYFIQNL